MLRKEQLNQTKSRFLRSYKNPLRPLLIHVILNEGDLKVDGGGVPERGEGERVLGEW